MNREEFVNQFRKLDEQDQREVMFALMPDFCRTMMSHPAQMQTMMQMCSQKMGGSFRPKNWGMPPFGEGADK